MKKYLLITVLLLIFTHSSFAQCDVSEVEVKVNILTDNWGEETSWTLSDLLGNIILQGGQGGVYNNLESYSDSICVESNACLIFEIYDTWGDGIYAPYGCEVFVNDVIIYSGANDIGNYASIDVNCWDACGILLSALNDLQSHINQGIILNATELTYIRNVFMLFGECLAESEFNILLAKSVVEDYDNGFGAIFTTPSTQNGFSKDPNAAPGMELERAIIALQQAIFDFVFTTEVYNDYPQHITDWVFEACNTYPGYVAGPLDSTASYSIPILANFADPIGVNPFYDYNGDGTEHALRPTGFYLAPGSVAIVTVPPSLVGQDYYIRVGSHEWDLTERTEYRRFDRISKKFPINATSIEVFNPFGGAISILVPYGANNGVVEVSANNCLEAPFFSLKSFYETPDFNAELNKPGPWAVFETENVMFTIPSHTIDPGEYDLMQAMVDWETAVRGVNSIIARQIIPDKHSMYMISDIDIRFGAYSIGYPMSNTPQNYIDLQSPAYFLNGPGPDDETNFHEAGHAWRISKFPGEEEAFVNFPYIMALNYGLNEDLNEAVLYSFVPNTFNIDKTATHRMVSNTFGSERDISNTETDEVRYQHRGYGHYFEIVNILGWCPIRNLYAQEFIDFENDGIDYFEEDDIDSRIIRMSVAAQADLRPLFHVFGILPQNPIVVQNSLVQAGVLPSLAVYNRLQAYFDLIPEDNIAFVDYALSVYPGLYTEGPTENPLYGVGWHYLKSLSYNAAEAQQRTALLQSIVDLYFPNGEPTENGTVNVCCTLDTMNVSLANEEVIVTGGVQPYDISIDTTGNVMTVTVIDFDGCESMVLFTLTSLTEEDPVAIRIYPNPASTEIYLDLTGSNEQINNVRLVSINGQVIIQSGKADRINISLLSEGIYVLQIQLVSGKHINEKVVILR